MSTLIPAVVTLRYRATALMGCAAALGLALISGGTVAQVHPPYRMLDSGFPAEDFWPTAWIDNNRVLFHGVELGTYGCDVNDPRRCGGRGFLLGAYVWDVGQNRVTRHKDRILVDLCIHSGYISYKGRESLEDKQGSIYAGEFGKEKRLGFVSEHRYNNPASCRYYSKPWLPDFAKGRKVGFLLEEHGFIDFGPLDGRFRTVEDREDGRPKLRSLNSKKAIPLDIDSRYRANWAIKFSYLPFESEYFAKGDTGNAAELTPAFYLSPRGDVRMVEFPTRRFLGGSYVGVRPGVFLSTDGDREHDSAGGYLLTSPQMTKVITGALRRTTVSPDGCRVAFVYAPHGHAISDGYRDWREGKPGNTIRMVDVCEGAQK